MKNVEAASCLLLKHNNYVKCMKVLAPRRHSQFHPAHIDRSLKLVPERRLQIRVKSQMTLKIFHSNIEELPMNGDSHYVSLVETYFSELAEFDSFKTGW